jgi:hypothetical protein
MSEAGRIRKQTLVLRVNPEERALLQGLARAMAVSMSDAMRLCIRLEAERRGVAVPVGRPAKRRR